MKNIKLTDEEVKFILEVLGQVQYSQVVNLINNILSQVEDESI